MADTQASNTRAGGGIIGWFTANPVAANLLMILVIALGAFSVGNLQKEAFPSIEPNKITVSVTYDSGSAKDSEEGLAIKIEDALEGVTGIKTLSSESNGRGTTVTVEKQSDYDLETLLQDVKSKVDAISTFPAEAEKPVISKAQRQEHALWIQFYGDTSRHSLQQLADHLKSDLLEQDQISQVTLSGWLDPMMVIEIDEGALQAYDLSLSTVEDAINRGSSTTMTALLRSEGTYLQLQASEQAYMAQDFAALPLLNRNDGSQVTLGQVARIRDTYDDTNAVLSRFNQHSSVALQVVAGSEDDISDSVAAAQAVVARWQQDGSLPEGVALTTWYDRSESINDRLNLLVKNALGGIALVFVLLALFLNLSVAFWVAAGLPFIFFGTLYLMGHLGLTLNEFTTFGFIMALGIVVDDAVVVGESVYATRARDGDTLANTIKGTLQVAVPTLFGVFTTVAAFATLSNIEGMLGELYAQFAMIVALCLILSVVESKLILPAHLSHLNTRRAAGSHPLRRLWSTLQRCADGGMNWFNQRIYARTIDLALRYRYGVVILFLALFIWVMAMPMNGTVRMSFFPKIAGDTVRAQISMLNDASFGLTHRNLLWMEQQAYRADRELRQAESGASAIAHLQVLSEADQSGKVTVELAADAPYDINQFTQRWQALIGQPEGVRSVSVKHSPDMVDALRIELRANDDELLRRAGEQLRAELRSVAGVSGLEDNLEPGQPQLKLELNALGQSLDLSTADLAQQVLQSFSGQVVQRYQRNKDEIEVRVRYPEQDRQNWTDVLNARIRTNEGTPMPLSTVAHASFGYTRDSITRIDGKRAVYLSADVDKEVVSSTELVTRLQRELVPNLLRSFPGLSIKFAGEAEQQAETQHSMLEMFLLAMLVIYMLLAIPLRSYVQPILIMTAIPFGVVGAILGHWINDLPLGILSLNGIIALSGVVVNDSLLLVARFNDLHPDSEHYSEAIHEACHSRLRAVLLTSITTFAGLMPLLSETSHQAQFLIPAAVSLGYGILFATLITLILIPALLYIQQDVMDGWQRLSGKPLQPQSQPRPQPQQEGSIT
ncbi:efflux RND transporter permease subunit [Ketobacter sp.]|uniref:efflux RND transporter permease subunit n=1 Tax=Ketobacter sp. TaxID=2083498 RepID=UPI000F2025A7|nr:efflux RND transporter permease subunit [Ketobacter sp.]RLT94791.1 MAG: efflux RND transporter permease subunit [Ketobacter sp.]